MKYPPDDITNVVSRADLVRVVEESVTLRRVGTKMVGLCPFHDERTGSFSVDAAANLYYCFGCGEGGDVITFVRETQACSFPEAVEQLADRFGVTLHPSGDAEQGTPGASFHEINEAAATWFGQQLKTDAAAAARTLLIDRGFDVEEAIERFSCGFAPTSGLIHALTRQGFKPDLITEAGLGTKNDRGAPRERFRNRLLWTIRNPFGKASGFGARRLRDDDPIGAKFINTSETPVYHKSSVLYGLHFARKTITRLNQAVVVEGYADVMAMHLAGVTNAVAACGTAFTAEHLALLRRIVGDQGEIVFGFDGDTGGRKAALKVYDLARGSLRRLSCLTPNDGMDPDDIRRAHGDEALRALIQARRPLIERVMLGTIDGMPVNTIEDRRSALDAVLPTLKHVTDPVTLAGYGQAIARRLDIDSSLVAKVIGAPLPERADPTLEGRYQPSVREDILRALCHDRASTERWVDEILPFFQAEQAQTVLSALNAALWEEPGRPWPDIVLSCVATEEDRKLILPLVARPIPVAGDKTKDYVGELVGRLNDEAHQRTQEELLDALSTTTDVAIRESLLKELTGGSRS